MTTNLTPRPLGDDDLEQALRGAFHHGADAAPAATDPWARTTRAVRRSQVRRRTAALAVAASVALVGVVGTATGSVPFLRADRPTVANPDAVQVTTDDVATWPTRGDRAKDLSFLAKARAELAREGDVLGVPYAGGLAGRRLAIGVVTPDGVAADDPDVRQLVAVVEQDDPAQPWIVVGNPTARPGVVTLAVQDADRTTTVLVLTRTDTSSVAVSPRPLYDEQGVPRREFRRLTVTDGIAVGTVPAGPWSGISVLTGDGTSVATVGGIQLVDSQAPPVVPDPALTAAVIADARCQGRTDALDIGNIVTNVMANRDPLNPPAAVEPVWCRDVQGGRVALLRVTLQDGTVFRSAGVVGVGKNDALTERFDQGVAVPRRGAAPVPAVLDDAPMQSYEQIGADGLRYFVDAQGAATVRVDGTSAGVTVAVGAPDRDGFLEVRFTQAQRERLGVDPHVVLLDAAGRELSRAPLQPVDDDHLDRSVVGPVR